MHPNQFKPDPSVVNQYFSLDESYFIIRFAQLNAHHDDGIKGIDLEITKKLIEVLSPYGRVYITSEKLLEPILEPYRLHIKASDIHHFMAFAQLYIGDSQTMAAESGVLGVPFIRFNDFVGKIGYLNELENKFELGYGIKADYPELLIDKVQELLQLENRKQIFFERRNKLLCTKIDYAQFLTWFIEEYPKSVKIIRENPDYQYNFK